HSDRDRLQQSRPQNVHADYIKFLSAVFLLSVPLRLSLPRLGDQACPVPESNADCFLLWYIQCFYGNIPFLRRLFFGSDISYISSSCCKKALPHQLPPLHTHQLFRHARLHFFESC